MLQTCWGLQQTAKSNALTREQWRKFERFIDTTKINEQANKAETEQLKFKLYFMKSWNAEPLLIYETFGDAVLTRILLQEEVARMRNQHLKAVEERQRRRQRMRM